MSVAGGACLVLAFALLLPARAGYAEEYPPALLQHFMKARNLSNAGEAKKTVYVKARPDVDLDGKPDYLVQLRKSDHLCIYEVYRSSSNYEYSGQVACCNWTERKAKDHLEFVCKDSADMDTDRGTIAWRSSPWSYGDASATPNPSASGGQVEKGVAALKAKRYKEAQSLLSQAMLNGAPKTAELQYQYALAVKGAGNAGVAQMELMSALRIDPKYGPALLTLGDWLWDDGEKQLASQQYKKYLDVATDPAGIEHAKSRLK
jgi:tetratricopeptide (TPR) repeat protein